MTDPSSRITELIEASSLGTPEAKALRDSVPDDVAARIVARSKQLGERCPSCDHHLADHSEGGCWYTVTTGRVNTNLVCACSAEPR